MSGTTKGGKKARDKNLARDPDFYVKIGTVGGKNGHTGGFAFAGVCNCAEIEGQHKKAQCAGSRGGRVTKQDYKTNASF